MEKCECMVYDKKRSPYDPEDHMSVHSEDLPGDAGHAHYAGDIVC